MYFAKSVSKNIGKVSVKYNQKLLGNAKKSATDSLKASLKRIIQKIAEATSDLIGYKITDRIIKVSRNSQQNNSETVTNEHDKEIFKEKYVSPEER